MLVIVLTDEKSNSIALQISFRKLFWNAIGEFFFLSQSGHIAFDFVQTICTDAGHVFWVRLTKQLVIFSLNSLHLENVVYIAKVSWTDCNWGVLRYNCKLLTNVSFIQNLGCWNMQLIYTKNIENLWTIYIKEKENYFLCKSSVALIF